MYVGIDVGRSECKVVGANQQTKFPSVVGGARKLKLGDYANYRIEVNSKAWFVGDLAEESYDRTRMALENKRTEETRILFATACAIMGVGEGATIVTGLPVYQHTEEEKAAFADHLVGRYNVLFTGETRVIDIAQVLVIPEGAGAFWNEVLDDAGHVINPELKSRPTVRVIDAGSRTVNYVTLKGGKYLDRDSGSLQYGCLELQNGATSEGLARRITGDLSARWADLRDDDLILLAGGGTLVMGKHFQDLLKNPVHVAADPVFANAGGMRKLGIAHERTARKDAKIRG